MLAPATAARLARAEVTLPEPWGKEARDLFTRLLAAGPGLLTVWETLDETGALDRLLPEWHRVRLLPHASVVHRFTVDRHLVETCVEASRLIRRVARPDVLMVAALLHDIGKGERVDHSVAGEPLAAEAATRMGFDAREVALVGGLVRWHLLLAEAATTRDLEDPATVAYVAARIPDAETLDLLEVLTEADARATSPKAWTSWRAGLVADLARRVRAALADAGPAEPAEAPAEVAVPAAVREDPRRVDVRVATRQDGATVTFLSGDRVGLIADVAGTLAVQRVVGARRAGLDAGGRRRLGVGGRRHPPRRERAAAALRGGRRRPARPGGPGCAPAAATSSRRCRSATRRPARPPCSRCASTTGPAWSTWSARALARLDLSVRSAHVATLGPQAVDVFYVQEPGAGVLSDERAASAVHAVRRALQGPVTLDADRG